MQQLGIPGVGLSLIDGGKVVFQGGLGVKTLGKPDPVDADTLFLAASNTKAMTTLLLAELVDENKLRWDQPVTDVYPDFKLGDAATTRQVLVKHLLCACTGLPRQDFEWLFNYATATPASSLASLAAMQPTSRFGEVYQYSNVMAGAAGYVGAHLVRPNEELGAAYDEAMRSKVFGPLGMTRTTFDFPTAMNDNFASPHGDDVDGKTLPARMDNNYSVLPLRPAGGMWTSARDLSKYLLMELALGALPDGTRLVSNESLVERRRPQIRMGEDTAYGMGLVIDTRYGIPVVQSRRQHVRLQERHDIPARSRRRGSGSHERGHRRFPDRPVAAAAPRGAVRRQTRGRRAGQGHARTAGAPTSPRTASGWSSRRTVAEAGKLAASYVSPALGTLRVRAQDGATIFDFAKWRSAVASRRNDDGTTSFISIDPTISGFNFVVGERDGKRALIVRAAQQEYAFIETAPP